MFGLPTHWGRSEACLVCPPTGGGANMPFLSLELGVYIKKEMFVL